MEEEKVSFKQKIRNYSFLSILMFIVAAVSILVDAAGFVCYQLSGTKPVINTDRKGQLENALANNPILGMAFFLMLIVSVILAIVVVYKSFPYMKPKDKMTPNRALPIFTVVNGAFHIAVIPFYFLIIMEHGRTEVGIIIVLVFTFLLAIAQFLFLYPTILGRYYMPDLKKKAE